MSDILIVGGGLAGLFLSKVLCDRGIEHQGLEKDNHLGGRLEAGHLRFYAPEARDAFSDLFPQTQWEVVVEAPIQVRKGAFEAVTEALTVPERSFLGHPFARVTTAGSELIAAIPPSVTSHFHLRSPVSKLDLKTRTVITSNGTEIPFRKLVWTGSLAGLLKACGQTPKGLSPKKGTVIETGGMTWDVAVKTPLFECRNTLVFPFRYKDNRFHALGMRSSNAPEGLYGFHWLMFLEDAWLENREELAKIVRTLKRELGKQFPALEESIVREKLAFQSSLSGETPVPVRSLEIFEGIACVGPDVQTEELSPVAENHPVIQNADRVLRNCLDFSELILPGWKTLDLPRTTESAETVASL